MNGKKISTSDADFKEIEIIMKIIFVYWWIIFLI